MACLFRNNYVFMAMLLSFRKQLEDGADEHGRFTMLTHTVECINSGPSVNIQFR